jgi:hypothetical protein
MIGPIGEHYSRASSRTALEYAGGLVRSGYCTNGYQMVILPMRLKSFSQINLEGVNPRLNLPGKYRGTDPESAFLAEFQTTYLRSLNRRGVAYRDFPLQGYGIPDLVWLSWRHLDGATVLKLRKNPAKLHAKKLTAFEIKLVDWRKGMMQAYRYSYFANRSILVVPPSLEKTVRKKLGLFHAARVGLWVFDRESQKIRKLFTPRLHQPKNRVAHLKAIQTISRLA